MSVSFSFGMFPQHRAIKSNIYGQPVWHVWKETPSGYEVLVKLFTTDEALDEFVGEIEDSEMMGI